MLEQGVQYKHFHLQTKKDCGRQHYKSKYLYYYNNVFVLILKGVFMSKFLLLASVLFKTGWSFKRILDIVKEEFA